MCEPTTIALTAMAASSALGAGSQISQYEAQKKQARQNRQAALDAMMSGWTDLGIRGQQEETAANQTIMGIDRQARRARGQAAVSAGEAGVSGVSVDALLDDITGQGAAAKETVQENLAGTEAQIEREKLGIGSQAQNRINVSSDPSKLALALGLGSTAIDFASSVYGSRGNGGKTSTGTSSGGYSTQGYDPNKHINDQG